MFVFLLCRNATSKSNSSSSSAVAIGEGVAGAVGVAEEVEPS